MKYEYFLLISGILLGFALVSAYANRNRSARWVLIVSLLLALPGSYVMSVDLLSRPKPTKKEWVYYQTKIAEVIGFHGIAGQGLYILLLSDEMEEPRYYSLPWDEKTREMIKNLQDEWSKAQKKGGKVFMYNPFDASRNNEQPVFRHPNPRKRSAPKDLHASKPKEFAV